MKRFDERETYIPPKNPINDVTWIPGITLKDLERMAIKKAMQFYRGNKTAVSQSLDIAIRTLDAKLKSYEEENNEVVPNGLPTQKRF